MCEAVVRRCGAVVVRAGALRGLIATSRRCALVHADRKALIGGLVSVVAGCGRFHTVRADHLEQAVEQISIEQQIDERIEDTIQTREQHCDRN